MIELAVFDMAGTTIDDGGAVYRALSSAVTGAGATVEPGDLQTWMGTDKVTAITALLELGGVTPDHARVASTFDAFKQDLARAYAATPPFAFDGVESAIATLRSRGIKVALSTGFDRDVAEGLLGSLGWTVAQDPAAWLSAEVTLDAVVTTSDVRAGRPAPYLIHHAMELTGVRSVAAVLAAGDTLVDLEAARNAGVVSVGVLTGALSREALSAGPFDYVLDGVADVPDLPEAQESALAPAAAAAR
ncbi:phosphonoacetaldehyde hydrolase [Frondihabitans sucicola]|uniref:Phosphonoacetaldehyde hydrolase n=1 Tax=Frondihabitans sucicola TaxID=1268041 RepID=A0ABM8GL75_9MICO|nr:phosphonatase-like hydrolase [Frondihabitans sucicola]BDZ49168.1 phosphonoacetaldehyde hydrolase [Frondihabitans sucicola]